MFTKKLAVSAALALSTLAAFATAAPASAGDDVVLSFAVLGDAEPKPKAEFPNLDRAVKQVNELAEERSLDYIVGVGDMPHKGTKIQYKNITPVLQQLTLPFYPIMGNEEHGSTVERYLKHVNLWNGDKADKIDSPSYVKEHDSVALVFASPDFDRDFKDKGIDWMLEQIKSLAPKPVLLIVHSAQAGIYPEDAEKGVHNPRFSSEVVTQPNVAAVISGDLHMDMDRTNHSKEVDGVHYVHIPALERTKTPDESKHNPMFRVFALKNDGEVVVDTYQVDVDEPLERHAYTFNINR